MSNLVHACHLAEPRGVTRWLNISRLGICAQDYADVQTARLSYMHRNDLVYNEELLILIIYCAFVNPCVSEGFADSNAGLRR